MQPRLVSIAIPTFNAEATLPLAVKSIFAQTYTNWELLIIDDGSTDGTSRLISKISDPRVRIIHDGQNRGLPYRLNQAAAECSGDLLFRMDADDIMHPERVERQANFLFENEKVDLLGTAVATIDENNQITGIRGEGPLRRNPKEIFKRGLFIHPTVAGRTSWFRENPYNTAYRRSQDFELWCRTASTLRGELLPEPLLFYRDGYSSASNYRVNAANGRRIIWELGREKIGLNLTLRLIASRWLKQAVHSTAEMTRTRHLIIRRRTRHLSLEQRSALESALNVVMATPVPGLK